MTDRDADRPWSGPPPWKGAPSFEGPRRDPDRVEPILDELRRAWELSHDQRLGQLLKNVLRGAGIDVPPTPVFDVEDDTWFAALRWEVRRAEALKLAREVGLKWWRRGGRGKFLVTPDGMFHQWQIDDTGAPHHQQVAERLGVRSVVAGEIDEDGGYWATARDPDVDSAAVMRIAAAEAAAIGLRPAATGS